MRIRPAVHGGAIAVLLILACASQPAPDTLYQTSAIDALLAGVYDGETTLEQLTKHGGLGLGTFDRLDGEMIVLDGEVYQVKASGRVVLPDDTTRTPFAAVCRFAPERSLPVPSGVGFARFEAWMDSLIPNQNLFYAFRVEGEFSQVRTRSVPAQAKPYPPLAEVAADQPEFEMENLSGTLIGFRCPPFARGVNVSGYHLHFLSADKSRGGHVLAFSMIRGRVEWEPLYRLMLQLPERTKSFATVDLSQNRTQELKAVEN